MCGRFYVNTSDPEILPFFNPDQWILPGVNEPDLSSMPGVQVESLATAGEVSPDNSVPVLSLSRGEPHPLLMGWGFPKWGGRGLQFNARAETAHKLRSFRESLAKWRVVVPTSGFYEWRAEPGQAKKVKYLFTDPAHPVLHIAAIAGIFQRVKSPVKARFCILTRDSKDTSVEAYHSRMPVILREHETVPWMKGPGFTQYLTQEPFKLAAAVAD